jgi:hypothetical protein
METIRKVLGTALAIAFCVPILICVVLITLIAIPAAIMLLIVFFILPEQEDIRFGNQKWTFKEEVLSGRIRNLTTAKRMSINTRRKVDFRGR